MTSTEGRLMRLAMQSDKGYTAFQLNDKNVEGEVTVT
jgi:hypothetical protein